MMLQSFLSYANFKWFKLNLLLVVVLLLVYLLHSPLGGPNGGTILGYTYGAIATLAILYLMWFGVRKRSYHSSSGTLQGWLACHVWLGLSLILVVPLHSGFSFGWNIHSLAYLLMVLVIISGFWGACAYLYLPGRIQSHRGGASIKELAIQLENLSDRISQHTSDASNEMLEFLSGIGFNQVELSASPTLKELMRRNVDRTLCADQLSSSIQKIPESHRQQAYSLIALINKRLELLKEIRNEVSAKCYLKIWLYFHVPLAFALLAALAIHIFSVFYYW